MPRIYALAKELGLDSKDLVEVCTKAGVTGKGSALASLSTEEVDKIKVYLKGGRAAAKPAAPQPAERDPVSKPVSSEYTRDDYIAPTGTTGKPKTIVANQAGSPETEPESNLEPSKTPAKQKEPVVKLAAMPTTSAPEPSSKSSEPAPQKPELRLPPDAIRGAKEGAKAPLEQFTKPDKRRRPGEPGPSGKEQPTGTDKDAPLSKAAGRKRRGKSQEINEEEKGRVEPGWQEWPELVRPGNRAVGRNVR